MTLFPREIKVFRTTGKYVKGVWTQTASEELSVRGSFQPVSGKDLEGLAVGRQDLGKAKVYTSDTLLVSEEGGKTAGDIVIWKGRKWETIAELGFQNELIPHKKYIVEYRGKE